MWSTVRRPVLVIGAPVGVIILCVLFGLDSHLLDNVWFLACLVIISALALLISAQAADPE
jgi:hypothetical protein